MKKNLVFLVAFMAMLLASCASNKLGGEKVPNWVISEPASTDEEIYAVGSGRNTDPDMALKMAKADAMNNLAKKINLKVNDVIETTITAGDGTTRKYEENSTQTTDSVLKNADVKDYFEKKDGTVYVLMYMPVNKAY